MAGYARRMLLALQQSSPGQQLTDQEIEATLFASDVVSAISAIGSAFILFCYWRFKHLRKFAFTLVAILSATDVLNQLTEFVQPSTAELEESRKSGVLSPSCWVQALTDSYFELASVLWTSAIAATLYLVVFYRLDQSALYGKLKWMALVCYGIPAVLMLLPLTDNGYGVSGAWCWIPSESKWVWQWVVFYAPLLLAIAFNTVVYLRTYALLRRTVKSVGETDTAAQQLRAVMKRLQLYPVVLAVIWAPAIVNRIYEAATGRQVFGLFIVQRIFSSSQGAWNAVVYGLSQGVKEALHAELAAWFPQHFTDPTVTTASDLLQRASQDRGGGGGFARGKKPGPGDDVPLQAAAGGGRGPEDEDDDVGDDDIRVDLPARASIPSLDVGGSGRGLGGTVVANPVSGLASHGASGRQGQGQDRQGQGQGRQGRVQAMMAGGGGAGSGGPGS